MSGGWKAGAEVATDEMEAVRMGPGGFRRIGSVRLTGTQTFTRHFETASWWRQIACPPQEVALMADARGVYWSFDGVVVDSYTPSRLMGVTAINPNDAKDVGKSEAFSSFSYAYWLAERLGTGVALDGLEIQLDRGYGVASETHERRAESGGGEFTLWHFTMPAAGHPLVVQQTERVRDPERYGMSNVTFAVTYFGEERGPVTVAINENRSGDGGHAQALRAAEALVFPSASAS